MLKPAVPFIIYIHGFNSSPASHKAQYLAAYLKAKGWTDNYLAPVIDYQPQRAIESLVKIIEKRQDEFNITLIGSSLGGYYATFLTEKLGINSVLINPAVAPYRMLANSLGMHENYHTGERYQITRAEVDQLQILETGGLICPERYQVFLQTGDETLDYREAAQKYALCRQKIEQGGSHGYDNFDTVVPEILAFSGIKKTS